MTSRQAQSAYSKIAGPAVRKVGIAVKNGKLVRQPCIDCGDLKVQAHHPRGYDDEHALDIEWLCRRHHMVRHRRSTKPTWYREGIRRYMTRTRPNRDQWRPRIVQVSELSSPVRLLQVLEQLWGLFVTDEERTHALALIERLSTDQKETAA